MDSFMITLFYTTFHNNVLENDWVWLTIILHLRYRDSIWNKETKVRYCSCTKMFLNKAVNFKDFSRPYKEIKYFSKTLTKFKKFSRQILKIQDLFKIVQTMKGRARYRLTKSLTMTSKKWPAESKMRELLAQRTSWNSNNYCSSSPDTWLESCCQYLPLDFHQQLACHNRVFLPKDQQ